MAFIGSVTQSGIRSGDVTPGVSVLFSVVFKNLGEIGGTVAVGIRRVALAVSSSHDAASGHIGASTV